MYNWSTPFTVEKYVYVWWTYVYYETHLTPLGSRCIDFSPSIIRHYRVRYSMMFRMIEYIFDKVCGFFVKFHWDKNCFWHIKIFKRAQQKVAHLQTLFCRISICFLSSIKFSLCRNGGSRLFSYRQSLRSPRSMQKLESTPCTVPPQWSLDARLAHRQSLNTLCNVYARSPHS